MKARYVRDSVSGQRIEFTSADGDVYSLVRLLPDKKETKPRTVSVSGYAIVKNGQVYSKKTYSDFGTACQALRDMESTYGYSRVNENKNMKKNVVRINENTLRQIVAESVKKVLKEELVSPKEASYRLMVMLGAIQDEMEHGNAESVNTEEINELYNLASILNDYFDRKLNEDSVGKVLKEFEYPHGYENVRSSDGRNYPRNTGQPGFSADNNRFGDFSDKTPEEINATGMGRKQRAREWAWRTGNEPWQYQGD